MTRNAFLVPCLIGHFCFGGAPVIAQQNATPAGEWKALLPSKTDSRLTASDGADAAVPELVRTDRFGDETLVRNGETPEAIRIGSVLIETSSSIDHAMFETVIEPYLGTSASHGELARLAQQIADVARAKGMLLASTYVPEQQVEMGIVRIMLDAGTIDEVRIEGSSNQALRDLLDPLVGGPVMQAELERRLMLANNIPQISVGKTELLNENGQRVLLVKVEQRKQTSGQLVVDNFGSKNVGPFRARLSVEAVALLADSDSMNVTFRTNPADPGELVAASVAYAVGLNSNGTRAEIATAWSRSEIAPSFGFGKRDVSSQYASLAVNHPLRRSRNANLWVDGQVEYLKIEQESFGAILQSDTVVTLSVGLSSSLKVANGWLRTGTQLRQGLGVLGTNRQGDPFSSRFDADGQFTSARAWASWSGKPIGDLTLRVAVSGQLATEPLLSSEEMGLGGAFIGRAFEFYERSGDQGILALAEIGYEFSKPASWIKRLQPYAFVDGGYVSNLRGRFGGGTLISAGGGVRADVGNFGLKLETAFPVHISDSSTSTSEPEINVQLAFDF
jgi:hemolysin activation/secretion protein